MMNESIEPKKRGRPKLAPKDVKDNYVPMRLNNEDFAAFTEAAQNSGHSLSEWIRLTLRKATKPRKKKVSGDSHPKPDRFGV